MQPTHIQLEIALKSFFKYGISKSESISENSNLGLNTQKSTKVFFIKIKRVAKFSGKAPALRLRRSGSHLHLDPLSALQVSHLVGKMGQLILAHKLCCVKL